MSRTKRGLSEQVNKWIAKNAKKYSRREIVDIVQKRFGFPISKVSVAQRESRLGIVRDLAEERRRTAKPREIEEDRKLRRIAEEKGTYKRKYERVLTDMERLEREIDAARAIYGSSKRFNIRAHTGRGNNEAVAVAVASDWHVEEIVQPHTVNNLNTYTPEIARKRAARFFQLIERMVRKERQDVPIKTLVLWLGGDFISGHIHDELKLITAMPPVQAAEYARELLESGIVFLLENTDLELVIPCSIGNHSRITPRVYGATEAGNSLEWFIYGALAKAFESEKRVRFIISESYLNIVEILGLKVRFHHGHAVRYAGGVGGLTIPLNKAIYRWNQTERVDLDVLGHFHDYKADKKFVVNGSLIGTTDYGLRLGFEHDVPTQGFFLLDKKHGKTVSIPLYCGEVS